MISELISALRSFGVPIEICIAIVVAVLVLVIVKHAFGVIKELPSAANLVKKLKGQSLDDASNEIVSLTSLSKGLSSAIPFVRGYSEIKLRAQARSRAKAECGPYISITWLNFITFIFSIIIGLILVMIPGPIFTSEDTPAFCVQIADIVNSIVVGVGLLFCLFGLYAEVMIMPNVNALAPIKSYRCSRSFKESKKAGYGLTLHDALCLAHSKRKYLLIDCRTKSERLQIPICNAISSSVLPDASCMSATSKREGLNCSDELLAKCNECIESGEPVLILSNTGSESHELAAGLRNLGFDEVYDIGGIFNEPVLYRRLARELQLLYG